MSEKGKEKIQCTGCGEFFKNIKIHQKHCDNYLSKLRFKSLFGFYEKIERKSYPIEYIHPNLWNVNSMTEKEYKKLKESIEITKGEYLKINPIKIRKIQNNYYEIIDGEHRWKVCIELKINYIPAILEDINIEESKTLNVILNRNRGKIDYFKLSKLLNEEYKDKDNNKKCTQQELAKRFGFSGQREIAHILPIYPRLKKYFEITGIPVKFPNDKLEYLARCKNNLLRNKLIEYSIKEKITSKKIRTLTTKFNKIDRFLDNEFPQKTKECILTIYCGMSLFELTYEKIIKKLFYQFTESSNMKCFLKYIRDFVSHSNGAEDFNKRYIKSKRTYTGWWKEYCKRNRFQTASLMIYNFFYEYYNKEIRCHTCKDLIEDFNDFSPHHESYEFKSGMLWFPFIDDIQIIYPVHTDPKCHLKGTSKY